MKNSYSYFIVKPDGVKYLDDICNTLEGQYAKIKYYAIDDYKDITKKLYYKHFESKGESFAKSFDSYLYGLTEIFGNQAILAVVAEDRNNLDELVHNIHETKTQIREKYVNHNVGIVTNYGEGIPNFIRFISEEGEVANPRIMKSLGIHRISDMNVIHSPDANKEDTLKELQILLDSGIIDDKNWINESMLNQMRKYHTVAFQEDMKEEGYEGEAKPDISGFVKNEIQSNFDEEILL